MLEPTMRALAVLAAVIALSKPLKRLTDVLQQFRHLAASQTNIRRRPARFSND